MDQKMAKNLTDKKFSPKNKGMLFEIVRAKNCVLGRVIMEGNYFGVYTVYTKNEEYVDQLMDLLKKEGFWSSRKLMDLDKGYAVLEVSWGSEFVEINED